MPGLPDPVNTGVVQTLRASTDREVDSTVAAAISLFGLGSGAALATVVGVLVEVPVMLSVVKIVKATKPWYERRAET